MRFEVRLTEDAARDLEQIYDFIAERDGASAHVLDRLAAVIKDLSSFPNRGSHPKELSALGVSEYRQTFFKPCRVIYRVVGRRVFVYLVADGRQDMQTILARRLFGV